LRSSSIPTPVSRRRPTCASTRRATAPPGASFILARADALDAVPESEEGNNVTVRPLEIGDFVDLTLTAISGPASVKAGAAMTVAVTARNAGTVPAGPFRITLYLGAGTSVGASMVVIVPVGLASGLYARSAVADVDNAIPEVAGADGAAANGRVAPRAVSVLAP
jgi:hypothetical protein